MDFETASGRAESWVNSVAMIAIAGESGDVVTAYQDLTFLAEQYNRHAPVLNAELNRLASLSDSPVKWEHGRGHSAVARVPDVVFPHVWSSAHEAAVGIARLALDLLLLPLEGIADPTEQQKLAQQLLAARWHAIAMPIDEVATLQERIRRERAKLDEAKASHSMDGDPDRVVWLGNGRVKIGTEPPIKLEAQEAYVLQALIEAGGAASKPELVKCSRVEDVVGTMRKLKKRFPDHIVTPGRRGKGGYRTSIRAVRE